MVTTATGPEPGDDPAERAEQAERLVRTVVAGHPHAAIRRIVLWVLLFLCIGLNWPVPALGCAALLFGTDGLL